MELALLQATRLKGRLTQEAATVFVSGDASCTLEQLALSGLLRSAPTGYRLTLEGKERLEQLLADEASSVDRDGLSALYQRFEVPNVALKEVVAAWQIRPSGEINDHADVLYDEKVVSRLGEVHLESRSLVVEIGVVVPRLVPYSRRLESAFERVAAGDHTWLASPMKDSYHQVWFEMHEDLLRVLGLNRVDEAKAGRA